MFSSLPKLLPLFALSCFIALPPQAGAQEADLKKVIVTQQATIASQKSILARLQTDIENLKKKVTEQDEAHAKLLKVVVVKDSQGRVTADYATSAGSASSATYATSAGSASSASSATFCTRLRSEGGGNTVGVTWEGSTLFFNVDASSKVKRL